MEEFFIRFIGEIIIAGILSLIAFWIAFRKLPDKVAKQIDEKYIQQERRIDDKLNEVESKLGKDGNLSNEHTSLSKDHDRIINNYLELVKQEILRQSNVGDDPKVLLDGIQEYHNYIIASEQKISQLKEKNMNLVNALDQKETKIIELEKKLNKQRNRNQKIEL